jgi:hypothetical protein
MEPATVEGEGGYVRNIAEPLDEAVENNNRTRVRLCSDDDFFGGAQ